MSSTSKDKSSTSKKALTMADLMKSVNTKFVSPKKGEILEGTVSKLSPSEITVDIGAKAEAVVLEKDKKILKSLLSRLKLGDKVSVGVLNPESEFGYTVVSLRQFNRERVWEKLDELQKNKEKVDVTIDGITKGGYLVSTKTGISGFLPNSQAVFSNSTDMEPGKITKAFVIELNRASNKVIFSQKSTMGVKEFEEYAKNIKRGSKVKTKIFNVVPFGIFSFVEDGEKKFEAFIHISEIAWEKIPTVPEEYKQGETIEAEVLGLDREAKRINLSIKKLTKNPYEEKLKEYVADKKVNGSVSKVLSSGVLVDLGEGIEGFIKKDKIPPTVKYTQGSSVEATVIEVDKKQRVIIAPVLKEKPIGYR